MVRRSLLQAEIILTLARKSAPTITELARRVGSKRPSVSRSLHRLEEQGLVWHSQDGWALTEEGEREIPKADAKVLGLAEEASNLAERTSKLLASPSLEIAERPQFTSSLDKMRKHLAESQVADSSSALAIAREAAKSYWLYENSRLADLARQLEGSPAANLTRQLVEPEILELGHAATESIRWFGESVQIDFDHKLVEMTGLSSAALTVEKAVGPLFRTQELNSALLSNLAFTPMITSLEELARTNNRLLTDAIDDVLAVRSEILSGWPKTFEGIAFQDLLPDLTGINTAFEQLFQKNLDRLISEPPRASYIEYVVPTVTVRSCTYSIRNLVEAETVPYDQLIQQPRESGLDASGLDNLDSMLASLDPTLVTMRQGCWYALDSRSPDYLRHAATSQRELVVQVFEHLVPNSELPASPNQGPRLRERIEHLAPESKSDRKFAKTIADALLELYGQLNKYTHANPAHENALRGILTTGEGLLVFVLSLWYEQ